MNQGRVVVGYSMSSGTYGVGLHRDLGNGKDWGQLLRDDFVTKDEALEWAKNRARVYTRGDDVWAVEIVGTLT